MKTKPVTMLLMMLAGWINKEQQHMIDYLREENSILRDELSKATDNGAWLSLSDVVYYQ